MTGVMEFESWWVTLSIVGVLFLINNLALLLGISRRKKRTELLLRKSRDLLGERIRRLEEDLASVRRGQREHWTELRQSVARLEFGGNKAPTRFGRAASVGLDKKHQVCFLARQGLATDEISRKLNLYPGETELVLGLRDFGARTEKQSAQTSLL